MESQFAQFQEIPDGAKNGCGTAGTYTLRYVHVNTRLRLNKKEEPSARHDNGVFCE
jgi:hypothetical protein